MNLAHLLLRSARCHGERPALRLGTQPLYHYAAFARRAAVLARALLQRVPPGSRLGIFSANHPALLEICFGCWWAGLAVVPINPKLHPREVLFILEHSGAALAFIGAGSTLAEAGCPLVAIDSAEYSALLAGRADGRAAPAGCRGDELAWLFYTSGTTGRPKGVMLTHRNLLTMTLCYFADVDTVTRDDATLYAAPMSHGAGICCLPKDLIISSGSNIHPREVEEVLLRHPGIAEVSVVGKPDRECGETVVAFVAARGGERPGNDELDAPCGEHIARFKRPRQYHWLDALPKNHYGKVLKTELREHLARLDDPPVPKE